MNENVSIIHLQLLVKAYTQTHTHTHVNINFNKLCILRFPMRKHIQLILIYIFLFHFSLTIAIDWMNELSIDKWKSNSSETNEIDEEGKDEKFNAFVWKKNKNVGGKKKSRRKAFCLRDAINPWKSAEILNTLRQWFEKGVKKMLNN